MIYKEFLITAEPFNPDILSGVLWELNISGISEEVNCLKVFSGSVSKIEIENLLNNLQINNMLRSFKVEENYIEEKNWNEEWEKSREIIRVSDKFIIRPTFKNYNAENGEIVLTIDPKMSFGTGEHQTTKMMLQLEEKFVKQGMKVLDIGTGTGILAIAAIKLGASSAIANDVDEWCYENCIENSGLNNTIDKIEFRICTVDAIPETRFDMIIANIQKNILTDIAEDISIRIKPDGILLLSGLLYIDEQEIISHYNSFGFHLLGKSQSDEWLAIAMKKKS